MKKTLFLVLCTVVIIAVPCFAQGAEPADELNAAKTRANEARVRASDFEPAYFLPNEWKAAETLYGNAGAQNIPALFNASADVYNAIFEKTIPLFAQSRENEIMELRGNLIGIGARDAYPNYMVPADRMAVLAFDQYEAQDYYESKNSAAEALLMYQALTGASNAWLVRQEIREKRLEPYAPDGYNNAGETLSEAMDAYDSGNYSLSEEKSEEATQKYRVVLSDARRNRATHAIQAAQNKINESDEIARQAEIILKGAIK